MEVKPETAPEKSPKTVVEAEPESESAGSAGSDSSKIAESPSEPELIIDDTLVSKFSDKLVARTDGLSIERLEQVNSALIDLLWCQRHEWNRNVIIEALDKKLDVVTSTIARSKALRAELQSSPNFYA